MLSPEKEYLQFLKEKYGKHVTETLLMPEKLELQKGNASNMYTKGYLNQNKEKVRELIGKYTRTESNIVSEREWSFDFSGWIGKLDFSRDNVKEVMVIGMEPHIGKRDFQVAYGLRETGNNEFGELDEYSSNTLLWKNLNGLFGDDEDYRSTEFLNRFYITDMCHFAEQGKANLVQKIEGWKKIRETMAITFLKREIDFIKPKYIVSQGNDVANFIEYSFLDKVGKLIDKKSTADFKTELPPQCANSPKFKKYEVNGRTIIHLRLPHLASGNGNYFWIPAQKEKRKVRLEGLRKELLEFEGDGSEY
jgi:hypothetical protein